MRRSIAPLSLCFCLLLACSPGDDPPLLEPGERDAAPAERPPASRTPDAAATRDAASGGRDAAGPRASSVDAAVVGSPDAGAPASDASGNASGNTSDDAASAAAVSQLEGYLAQAAPRPELAQQPFADVPLTRADADRARMLLWEDLARSIRATRQGEVGASETVVRTIAGAGGLSLRYYLARRGQTPAGGRSLFISMHGGGSAPSATNDSQWKNQLVLVDDYAPKDAIWIAPRAPIDDWNMWFVEGIDALFERLIADMIVFEGIDPNKVYLTGYSAGGDGVYQLGPRMAERWAGAGMSAGHPNSASPLNLRNLPFAIHVGGNDTAFDRNKKAEEWGKQLEALAVADPGGYLNQWQVHAGLPHWMNMKDAVSVPFLQKQTRNPYPSKVVWRQAEVARPFFYWLAVEAAQQKFASEVRASYADATVSITGVKALSRLTVRLTDQMLDLDSPIRIQQDGRELFSGTVARTIGVLARTLAERSDPTMVFSAEVSVALQ